MLQYKLKIVGVVQEVGFRHFVRQEATRLGLVGSVWNCPDGSVEVVFQGEEALLDQLVEQCKLGPTYSKVASVDVEMQWAISWWVLKFDVDFRQLVGEPSSMV